MENQPCFDLNAAIQSWQQELAAQSNLTAEVRKELEAHLRDAIADLRKAGLSEEESFWQARRRVGQPRELGQEFEKAASQHKWRAVLTGDFFAKWWHPLLVFSCNSALLCLFLPGCPPLWMLLTLIGLFYCLVRRFRGREIQFFRVRSVSCSLLALAAVVTFIACLRGGGGLALSSTAPGSWRYLQLLLGVALYFVLSSVPIKKDRAGWYMGLFFLSALTGLMGLIDFLAVVGGSRPDFLRNAYLPGSVYATEKAALGAGAVGLWCFVLARYGVRGALDLKRPWRLLVLLLAAAGCVYSGFQSHIIVCGLIFVTLIFLEGMVRARHVVVTLTVAAMVALSVWPNTPHSPPASQAWRVERWQSAKEEVAKYLLLGKGYSHTPLNLHLSKRAVRTVLGREVPIYAEDYNNGPLSVLIPFGLPGAAALLWFFMAAGMALYRNCARGAPDLLVINRFLLGVFLVRAFSFIFVFGSLYSAMAFFCGLLGLAISLNGGPSAKKEWAGARAMPTEPAPELLPQELGF